MKNWIMKNLIMGNEVMEDPIMKNEVMKNPIMGNPMTDPLVKRIAGILYPAEDLGGQWFDWAVEKLRALWGEPEILGLPVPFTTTDYYRCIAPRLLRRFVCFQGLVPAGGLSEWKRASIEIEKASRTPRIVNIDPGYVDGARLVLASTKDHAHRIYLRDGIYAEVTMRFRFGKWASFDYTFPDFAGGLYDDFLSEARDAWRNSDKRRKNR
ncbi:MAG: DUF4416 family protein [Synergistaceae bacterium]|jgi:hypothetical protein|nr:DUF4416 family protein [Synergistaceae bacterium]